MKNTPFLLTAFLVTLSSISLVKAESATRVRFQKVYESTKKVDECSGGVASIAPLTFGEKGNEISILTFASQGSIMIGNNEKAFKLALDKGILQTFSNGKWENLTYVIDPSAFLKKLNAMKDFVGQALLVAQKTGKSKDVKQVTCASKIIEFTQTEHQLNKTKAKI